MNRIERHRGTVVILAALAAALVAYGLIVGFVIEPPPLGWVGFAIVSAVVLGLGMLAPLAFERTRVSALRPAEATTPQRRLLVIADPNSDASALSDRIHARLGNAIVSRPPARFPPSLCDRRRGPGAARRSRKHATDGRPAPAASCRGDRLAR
jgi:hypothetical protein